MTAIDSGHYRYPAKAYDGAGNHTGPGRWLALVHEANRVEESFFDSPDSTGDWWAGGWVEEYPHARVLHRTDESVSVIAKDDHGAKVLAEAAHNIELRLLAGGGLYARPALREGM